MGVVLLGRAVGLCFTLTKLCSLFRLLQAAIRGGGFLVNYFDYESDVFVRVNWKIPERRH